MRQFLKTDHHRTKEICHLIGRRAGYLFETRQLWCSAAALVALNGGLKGELSQDLAIRLTAGQSGGLGGGGCICGGLSGAVLALGLFLGNGRFNPKGDRTIMKATRRLHDQFKRIHGSTCCRVLLKKSTGPSKTIHQACTRRTAKTVESCADLILTQRPELLRQVNWQYLNQENDTVGARIDNAGNFFGR